MPMTVETWAGPTKPSIRTLPSSRTSGLAGWRWIAGGRQHVVAEDGEVRRALLRRGADRERGGRRRGLEADGEEHHLAVGFGFAAMRSASRVE